MQLSEGGVAALQPSQEEKGPSRGLWEPEGPQREQQGPAAEKPELNVRTGKTSLGSAPQNRHASPNTGAHQTSRRVRKPLKPDTSLSPLGFLCREFKGSWTHSYIENKNLLLSASFWPPFLVMVSYLRRCSSM